VRDVRELNLALRRTRLPRLLVAVSELMQAEACELAIAARAAEHLGANLRVVT
jgi:hypothetical protein